MNNVKGEFTGPMQAHPGDYTILFICVRRNYSMETFSALLAITDDHQLNFNEFPLPRTSVHRTKAKSYGAVIMS